MKYWLNSNTIEIVQAKYLDLGPSHHDPDVVMEKFIVPTYFIAVLTWSLLCPPDQIIDENSPINSTNGKTFIECLLRAKHCVKLWRYSDLYFMHHSLILYICMALSLEVYMLVTLQCSLTLGQHNIYDLHYVNKDKM